MIGIYFFLLSNLWLKIHFQPTAVLAPTPRPIFEIETWGTFHAPVIAQRSVSATPETMQNRNPNPGGVLDRVTVRDRVGAKVARLVLFFFFQFFLSFFLLLISVLAKWV